MSRLRAQFRRMMVVAVVVLVGALVLREGDAAEHDVSCAASPDGRQVVFTATDGDLYLLTLATRQVAALGKVEGGASSPRFAPDGQSIVYSAQPNGRDGSCLFLRSLDGQIRQLTNDSGVADITPSFSLDGQKVVFARAYRHRPYSMGGMVWDQYDISMVDRDGTNLRRLTMQSYYQAQCPNFVAGGRIVFAGAGTYPDMMTYLFGIPADGSQKPELLTKPPAQAKCAAWGSEPAASGDGKRLAFLSDRIRPYAYDVLIADSDGSNARNLNITTVSRYNQQPMFLPANQGVLFLAETTPSRPRKGLHTLWAAPLDGGKPVRIAGDTLFTDPLHWSEPAEAPQP